MSKRTRPSFSPEFRLEAAQLVVDQGRTVKEAANAMGVRMRRRGEYALVKAAVFEVTDAVAHIEDDEVVGMFLCELHVPATWHVACAQAYRRSRGRASAHV